MAASPRNLDFSFLEEISDQSIEDIVSAVRDGAESYAAAMGFTPEALRAIEQIALGYYRGRQFDRAALVYSFILGLDGAYGAAWRGLGACCHAEKKYALALYCYRGALETDASDVVSAVFTGECLCMVGEQAEGIKVLTALVARGSENPAYLPYLTRARALIAAEGGRPPRVVLMEKGEKLARQVSQEMVQVLVDFDDDKEIELDDIMSNPQLSEGFKEIAQALQDGRLTYADVGGFTENELDGAYAAACQYVEMGQVIEAMQICGYLMMLDPYNARYYQLVGISLQRLKQYEQADHYYRMALVNEKNDPMTLVYQGECKIMAGHVDEGLQVVRKGLELGGDTPEHSPIVERARQLLQQFGNEGAVVE